MTESESIEARPRASPDMTANEMRSLSLLLERAALDRRFNGRPVPRRDLVEVLGRKRTLGFRDFYDKYDRDNIAGRIVDAYPKATWRKLPEVLEDTDKKVTTAFELAYIGLQERLRLTHYLERADRLAGLGSYAVVLIGVRRSGALETPLRRNGLRNADSIIYLSVFGEDRAKIEQYETDPASPRFGQPKMYKLNFGDDNNSDEKQVHWTRLIHVAEDLLEDEVHGRPRLKRVFDTLDDLQKVVGGAAEMFWQGADKGLHADVRDSFEGELSKDDQKRLQDEMDAWGLGLQRFIRTQGVDLKPLGGTTADPRGSSDVILDLIAGASGIPKRMLLGSEQGELASSQDVATFYGRVEERQTGYAEPALLRAFIDRLGWLGALPVPKTYTVTWPALFTQTQKERATTARDVASAVRTFAGARDPQTIVPDWEFRETFLGLDPTPPEAPDLGGTTNPDTPDTDDPPPDNLPDDDDEGGEPT